MRARLTGDVSVNGGKVPPLSSRRVETKASRFPTGATDVPLWVLQEALLPPWAGFSKCWPLLLLPCACFSLQIQRDLIISCLCPPKMPRLTVPFPREKSPQHKHNAMQMKISLCYVARVFAEHIWPPVCTWISLFWPSKPARCWWVNDVGLKC